MELRSAVNLTGADLFAYLLLLSPTERKSYMICEGPSDCGVIDPHLVDGGSYETIPGYGKSSVLEAMALVEEAQMARVIGIVDRDWGVRSDPRSEITVHTDFYDLDATVFFSGSVVRRVVSSFCDREAVREFLLSRDLESPSRAVQKVALPLGVLRKISHDSGLGLRVAKMPLGEVVAEDLDVDVFRLVTAAIERSKGSRVSLADAPMIEAAVRSRLVDLKDDDVQDLCCGHDLSSALAFLMRTYWSSRVGADIIERTLRSSFGCAEFSQTALFRDVHVSFGEPVGAIFSCEAS